MQICLNLCPSLIFGILALAPTCAQHALMTELPVTLVCFAVKEEAAPFIRRAGARPGTRVLITGMGERNAVRALREALHEHKPSLVLTCGFAGGLKDQLKTGTVVFDCDTNSALEKSLKLAGAEPARFCLTRQVATTAAQKRALHLDRNADVVDMESGAIRSLCRDASIPCAAVRVVLDEAREDLPLDFNQLMTPDDQLDYKKLAITLLANPGRIVALLRLQRQSKYAAQKLAEVLLKIT
jgi:uridine phosphorylase